MFFPHGKKELFSNLYILKKIITKYILKVQVNTFVWHLQN